ncbi:hypothetical protein [Nostoc sp. WHI]|uniref:hypothetical protein n=1 Tax=Nostoc sp. WHI TaxID=2650611 RepID=UPI0018C73780|nr:hypothetical protein [Nostoc sp. WHI]
MSTTGYYAYAYRQRTTTNLPTEAISTATPKVETSNPDENLPTNKNFLLMLARKTRGKV